jgi:hypothetical protein
MRVSRFKETERGRPTIQTISFDDRAPLSDKGVFPESDRLRDGGSAPLPDKSVGFVTPLLQGLVSHDVMVARSQERMRDIYAEFLAHHMRGTVAHQHSRDARVKAKGDGNSIFV